MDTDRREFLKISGLLGLVANGAFGRATPRDGALRSPDLTGVLEAGDKADLWQLFAAIDRIWQLEGQCQLVRTSFGGVLDAKTSKRPSYLTEYRAALVRFRALREKQGLEAACEQLYADQNPSPLKTHVLDEFIALHMAFGGFRALGYRNAAGFAGGSFSDRDRLPYRTAATP